MGGILQTHTFCNIRKGSKYAFVNDFNQSRFSHLSQENGQKRVEKSGITQMVKKSGIFCYILIFSTFEARIIRESVKKFEHFRNVKKSYANLLLLSLLKS